MLLIVFLSLIEFDHSLFYLINSQWTNSIFDWLLPVWRDKYFWLPVYMFIILFSVFNHGNKSYWFILFLLAAVGSADLVSSHLVKKTIKRTRPCNDINVDQVRSLVECGSGYSFSSSHAANHFAISYFLYATLGFRYRKIRGWLIAWAISVGYAQVYVGLHFPIDILAGMIIGILMAKLFVWSYKISGRAIPDFV
jgi:undecaprenyl-diphosphatase